MHTNDTSLSDNSSEQHSNSLHASSLKSHSQNLKNSNHASSTASPQDYNSSINATPTLNIPNLIHGNHSTNANPNSHNSNNNHNSNPNHYNSNNSLPSNHPYHSIYSKLKNVPIPKDTTYTKIFVGGLPYHTTDESLAKHFEIYGKISEAVVITERQTAKSRGYGFVTMSDRASAAKACINPNPIIDGRKANVNLAYIGAKPRIMHQNLLFRGLAATLANAGYSGENGSVGGGDAPLGMSQGNYPSGYAQGGVSQAGFGQTGYAQGGVTQGGFAQGDYHMGNPAQPSLVVLGQNPPVIYQPHMHQPTQINPRSQKTYQNHPGIPPQTHMKQFNQNQFNQISQNTPTTQLSGMLSQASLSNSFPFKASLGQPQMYQMNQQIGQQINYPAAPGSLQHGIVPNGMTHNVMTQHGMAQHGMAQQGTQHEVAHSVSQGIPQHGVAHTGVSQPGPQSGNSSTAQHVAMLDFMIKSNMVSQIPPELLNQQASALSVQTHQHDEIKQVMKMPENLVAPDKTQLFTQ